jgi:hypothetical protein
MTDKLKSSVLLTEKVWKEVGHDERHENQARTTCADGPGKTTTSQTRRDWGECRFSDMDTAVNPEIRGGDLWICSSRAIFFGAGALPNTPLLAFPAMQAGWNFLHSVSLGNSLFTLPNISGLHSRSLD